MTGTQIKTIIAKQSDVVGIGASTVDVLTVVKHYPDHEGVQKAITTTLQGGGPVATALVALAKLGARTAMMDTIGDDWRGDLIKKVVGYLRRRAIHSISRLTSCRILWIRGCGDSYHGAFLFGLLRDMTIKEASSFASAVAALNTRQLVGRAALPTLTEVKTFLSKSSNVMPL